MTDLRLPNTKRKRSGRGNNPKDDVERARIEELQSNIWRLRAKGYTYKKIAKELGISSSLAHFYVKKKMDEPSRFIERIKDDYIDEQLRQIDEAIKLLWTQIGVLNNLNKTNPSVRDTAALTRSLVEGIKALVLLMERQAALLGLDAPKKVEDVTEREQPYIVFDFDPNIIDAPSTSHKDISRQDDITGE